MIEEERNSLQGDSEREVKARLNELAEADRMRSGYQELAAKGLMTLDELGTKLQELEETSKTARRELEALSRRRKKMAELE
jgi:polyhydroxyalkanoate synthesis regulator phasin